MASNSNEPMDKLKDVSQGLMKALGDKAMSSVTDRVGGLTDKLGDIADGGPIGKAVKQGRRGRGRGQEPGRRCAQGRRVGRQGQDHRRRRWRQGRQQADQGHQHHRGDRRRGADHASPTTSGRSTTTGPTFMKKVENADAGRGRAQGQVRRRRSSSSHREWEATIIDQIPDERIVWKSEGAKGHVDGAVTFHELGPNLTRILMVLEYYPQGLFERTGNLWRAQGRRARLEFKHFRRHVMTRTILDPDEVEGWRGTIEDGEIVETHDEVALEQEEQEQDEQERRRIRGRVRRRGGRRGPGRAGRRVRRGDEAEDERGAGGGRGRGGRRGSRGSSRRRRRASQLVRRPSERRRHVP